MVEVLATQLETETGCGQKAPKAVLAVISKRSFEAPMRLHFYPQFFPIYGLVLAPVATVLGTSPPKQHPGL